MHNYKIIHLSDLHLTESNNIPRIGFNIFKPLMGMNKNFRQIIDSQIVKDTDFILITGDITDTAKMKAWKNFGRIINKAGIKGKLLLIPGNHDVSSFKWLPRVEVKNYLSKKDINKYFKGLKTAEIDYEDLPYALTVNSDLVIIGLNSNNTGNSHFFTNAIGHISDMQFEKLRELLIKYNSKPLKLVVTHHSPNIPGIRTSKRRGTKPANFFDRITLQIPRKQRRRLRDMCKEYGVKAILHGHLHSFEDRRVDNVRMIGVGASTMPITGNKKAKFSVNQYKLYSDSRTLRRETIEL